MAKGKYRIQPSIIIGSGNNRKVMGLRKDRKEREQDVENIKNFICRPDMLRARNGSI